MIVKGNVKLGASTYQFEADEKDELDSLHKVIVLSSPRKLCNVCGDDGLENKKFTSNKSTSDKGTFTFVNVKCKCDARSQLGQYKTGGYFWKEYEKYQKPSASAGAKTEDDSLGDIS